MGPFGTATEPARIDAGGSALLAGVATELRANAFHALRKVRRMTVLAPTMLTKFRPNADASLTTPGGLSATLIPYQVQMTPVPDAAIYTRYSDVSPGKADAHSLC
jgi:hypothetical protein